MSPEQGKNITTDVANNIQKKLADAGIPARVSMDKLDFPKKPGEGVIEGHFDSDVFGERPFIDIILLRTDENSATQDIQKASRIIDIPNTPYHGTNPDLLTINTNLAKEFRETPKSCEVLTSSLLPNQFLPTTNGYERN